MKLIARQGMEVRDVDAKNSYFMFLLSAHAEIESSVVGDYIKDREGTLAWLSQGLCVGRAAAKKLLIALGFGGSVSGWSSEVLGDIFEENDPLLGKYIAWLNKFQDACRRCHRRLRRQLTEEQANFASERALSNAGVAFFLYADYERKLLDRCVAAAGPDLISREHDGLCVLRSAEEAVLAAAGNVAMVSKPLQDPWSFASEEHPEFDWQVVAPLDFRSFAILKDRCRLNALKGDARHNTGDYAIYAAEVLKSTTNVDQGDDRKSFEYFSPAGFWVTACRDDMAMVTHRVLRQLVRPPLAATWTPPYPLNELSFASSLVAGVMTVLAENPMVPLDGDGTRLKLLCSDGIVVNFTDGSRRKARPQDRLGLRAKANSKSWSPSEPTSLFENIKQFLLGREQDLYKCEAGRRVVEQFDLLAGSCPLLELLRNYGTPDASSGTSGSASSSTCMAWRAPAKTFCCCC